MRRALAVAATVALAGSLGPAVPASASSERMQLHCDDGRVVERSNGGRWWGVDHDAGYTTAHLLVEDEQGQTVYEKSYGSAPAGTRSTCVAEHFAWRWTVELVLTAPPAR